MLGGARPLWRSLRVRNRRVAQRCTLRVSADRFSGGHHLPNGRELVNRGANKSYGVPFIQRTSACDFCACGGMWHEVMGRFFLCNAGCGVLSVDICARSTFITPSIRSCVEKRALATIRGLSAWVGAPRGGNKYEKTRAATPRDAASKQCSLS